MSIQVQHRRGTTTELSGVTPAVAEVGYDTTTNELLYGDGSTAGGIKLAKKSDVTAKAPLASPTFTGTPAAPTAAVDTNTTQLASTAFVLAQASASGDGTPAMDGTAARGTSTHFARADHVHPTDTSLAPKASPTFTGTPAAPTAADGTNTTQLATTGFVQNAIALIKNGVSSAFDTLSEIGTELALKAPIASPTFTGNPTAPTPSAGDNDTSIATTAFVQSALDTQSVQFDSAQSISSSDKETYARPNIYAAPFDALAFNGMQGNSGCDISQENGTTQITLVSDTETYTADLWLTAYKNSGAVVKARQLVAASFPAALSGYSNAVELKATTALSSLANGDYAKHIHVIEGYRIARMGWGASGAQSLSYAFQYYNPGSTATIMVKLSNSDRSRCYYDEKSAAAGWNWVIGSLAGDTSGSWSATTGIGLRIEVFSAGKAASPATAGSWGSTNTTASSGMTQNILSTNNFAAVVTGLVVLPGLELPSSSRAPLIMRPFDQEATLCKRYWEKTYDYADAVGTNTWNGARYGVATSSTDISAPLTFQVSKRAASTVTLYSKTGTSGKWSTNGAVDTAAASAFAVGRNGFLEVSCSGLTVGLSYGGHFVADARL